MSWPSRERIWPRRSASSRRPRSCREKPDLNDFNLQLVTLYAQHAVASGALFVKRQERYMSELRKPVGERNVGGFPSVSDTVSLSRVEFSDYNSLLKGTKPDDVIARLSR